MKKGFTLIELLVVIAIIALLAALIAPAISNAVGKKSTGNSNAPVSLYSDGSDEVLGGE